jgi:hypothetical protein
MPQGLKSFWTSELGKLNLRCVQTGTPIYIDHYHFISCLQPDGTSGNRLNRVVRGAAHGPGLGAVRLDPQGGDSPPEVYAIVRLIAPTPLRGAKMAKM